MSTHISVFLIFCRKKSKIYSCSILIFRGFELYFFFQVQSISFVKMKANSAIEQQNCKGHEKRDRLLISKMEFNYQISHRNKSFTYRSSSQIGLILTKKCPS